MNNFITKIKSLYTKDKGYDIFNTNNPETLLNLSMNTLILGGTGSGKTASNIIPFLHSVIKHQQAALIVDVKNSFTDNIYKLEQQYIKSLPNIDLDRYYKEIKKIKDKIDEIRDIIKIKKTLYIDVSKLLNKEKLLKQKYTKYKNTVNKYKSRILEIGSYDSADNINIINGLDKETVKKILIDLVYSRLGGSKEPHWVETGCAIFKDIIDVYYYLYEEGFVEQPSLYILTQMTFDYELTTLLYKQLKELDNTREKEILIETIKGRSIHVFKDNSEYFKDEGYIRQLGWTIGELFTVFKDFQLPDNIAKFSNITNKDFVLDFTKLYYLDNKIVVLRFKYNDSEIGNIISILIKIKSKYDMVKNKTEKGINNKYVFSIFDEFQNIVSFDGVYNDNDWFATCREFKNIHIIATQSLSSLYAVSNNKDNANNLISNCKTKILLTNDDISTIEYFNKLKSKNIQFKNVMDFDNESISIYFDSKTRKEMIQYNKLNNDIEKELHTIKLDKKNKQNNLKELFYNIFDIYKDKKELLKDTLDMEKTISYYIEDWRKLAKSERLKQERRENTNTKLKVSIEDINTDIKYEKINLIYTGKGVAKKDFIEMIDPSNIDKINFVDINQYIKSFELNNSINVFVMGGNNEFFFNAIPFCFVEQCKEIIKETKNSINVLGLGHVDFQNSIIEYADYNYASPSVSGLMINNYLNKENTLISQYIKKNSIDETEID